MAKTKKTSCQPSQVVAEYAPLKALPEPLQTSLPTIEQIERELEGGND